MIACRRCVVLLLSVLAGSAPAFAQPSEICVSTIPANVQAGVLAEDLNELLQASATFRQQCARIAAVRSARVNVTIVQPGGSVRAETTITRFQAGALSADVRITFGQDYRELIAHEFEHIIEQLDGVSLRAEAASGRAWLIYGNVFETRRASQVGAQVRRECQLSEAHAAVAGCGDAHCPQPPGCLLDHRAGFRSHQSASSRDGYSGGPGNRRGVDWHLFLAT